MARTTPEKIVTFSVDPATGLSDFHGRRVAFALGLEGAQVKQCVALIRTLYRAFVEKDMEMLEINPLVILKDGNLKVLDAKIGFDNNALYRQPEVMALRDETEEDPKELAASKKPCPVTEHCDEGQFHEDRNHPPEKLQDFP